jgi:hypothetical protein
MRRAAAALFLIASREIIPPEVGKTARETHRLVSRWTSYEIQSPSRIPEHVVKHV